MEWYFSWHSVVLQKDGTELWWLWVFSSVPCEEHSQHVLKLSQVLLQLALNPYQKRSWLHWLPLSLQGSLLAGWYYVARALCDRDTVEDQPWRAGMTSYFSG